MTGRQGRVEVLEKGRRVRVGAGENVDVFDVFDYVETLIEEEGWQDTTYDTQAGAPKYQASSPRVGWTLHDAIGQFGTKLMDGKEANISTGRGDARRDESLRTKATGYVEQAIGEEAGFSAGSTPGTLDQQFNDHAKTVEEILAVVRRARELAEADQGGDV